MTGSVIKDTGILLQPDPSRVITRLFVPGREDAGVGDSRAASVVERIMRLEESEVEAAVADVETRFAHRHRSLDETFVEHAGVVASRIASDVPLSKARILLLGACFTHEYTIEGAALCNPSAVAYPKPDGNAGGITFVMSVRGIGEGHKSSIGFRTGTVSRAGIVTIDAPGPFPVTAQNTRGLHRRSVFHAKLAHLDDDRDNAAYVLDHLPVLFDDDSLEAGITALTADSASRRNTATTIANLRDLSQFSYQAKFPHGTDISERVLWPETAIERNGMEDARFVCFTHPHGTVNFYATYTAYDGTNIAQHLLETTDFTTFRASPLAGPAAVGKGLALFPRKVGGRFAALSRSDRETNAIAYSDDMYVWDDAETIQTPDRSWEVLQLGNCGSPIETAEGWLVITHGTGPMRTYSLAALLLDIDDPTRVIARTALPIMTPDGAHRDGYVPNVVYSCGGFAHGDLLVLPYGIGDRSISVATIGISALIASMQRVS